MDTGPKQLDAWIRRKFNSQREAAAYLGWDETYVSHLVNGKRTPGLDNALLLEQKTGIPVEAWASAILDKSEDDESAVVAKKR